MSNDELELNQFEHYPEDDLKSPVRVRKILSRMRRETGFRDLLLFAFVKFWMVLIIAAGTLFSAFLNKRRT